MRLKTKLVFGAIVLIITITLAYYASSLNIYYSDDQIFLECPVTIPQAYLQKITLLGQFIDGIDKQNGYSILKIDVKEVDAQEIEKITNAWGDLCQHVTNLESSTLGNQEIFAGFNVPYACPKDSVTQQKVGLYVQGGIIVPVANDPLCP